MGANGAQPRHSTPWLPLFVSSRCFDPSDVLVDAAVGLLRLSEDTHWLQFGEAIYQLQLLSFAPRSEASLAIFATDMSSTDNTSPPMADQANSTAAPSSPDRNKKKRIRNWTADDRAAHRVFERSRREAFKERLTVSWAKSKGILLSVRS